MDVLKVEPVDSVYVKVRCERNIARELSDYFTFKVPGYKFMPAYKNKLWSGDIKLFNIHSQTIYRGLVDYLIKFAKDRNYEIDLSDYPVRNSDYFHDAGKRYIESLNIMASGNPIKPHEHQVDGFVHAVNKERCLLLSPTASGKSLIIYSLMRFYLKKLQSQGKKILIIVPTTSLVEQLRSDFKDYSSSSSWNVEDNVHAIYEGRSKDTEKSVVISTWQSIHKLPKHYFAQFGMVVGDECHLFKAQSLTNIMTKLDDCNIRIGTTGTLDGTTTHKLVIEGLFGKAYSVITTKELMERKIVSNLKIDAIMLGYPEETRQEMKKSTYNEEMAWLIANPKRNTFITRLVSNLKGNSLVLFQFVENHGKVLVEMLKREIPEREVFFVHGGTATEDRETIRKIMEKNDNAIIVASYGTFSTGISIRRLHNIVFASPSKSRIRILQSIGRQLRLSEHKSLAKLYDLGDDLCWKSRKNHTFLHFMERLKIYESENFEFKTIKIDL